MTSANHEITIRRVTEYTHAIQTWFYPRHKALVQIDPTDSAAIWEWLLQTVAEDAAQFGRWATPLQAILAAASHCDGQDGPETRAIYDAKFCGQTVGNMLSCIAYDTALDEALTEPLIDGFEEAYWVSNNALYALLAAPTLEPADALWEACVAAHHETFGKPPPVTRRRYDACLAGMKKAPRARGALKSGTVVPIR